MVVSACLAGVRCRMDGKCKPVEEIVALYQEGKCVLVCPEVLGGLPTPRPSSEIRDGRVINTEGEDVTQQFLLGAQRALQIARENGCEMAVLKSKSPSCGIGKIYDGSFTRTLVDGNGMTARLFLEAGLQVMDEKQFVEKTK